MEQVSLLEDITAGIQWIREKGLQLEQLQTETRKMVWLHKRQDLRAMINAARSLEGAWKAAADCFEKELEVLMKAVPEIAAQPEVFRSPKMPLSRYEQVAL